MMTSDRDTWLAVEPGGITIQSESTMYEPAQYAELVGISAVVEMFRDWLVEQIEAQERHDRAQQRRREIKVIPLGGVSHEGK